MATRHRETVPSRTFAWVAFCVVVALYLPYFFLPVFYLDGPVSGAQALWTCLAMLPQLWIVLASHCCLWLGAGMLLARRWRLALWAGGFALALSLGIWVLLIFPLYAGLAFKLLSMLALVCAARWPSRTNVR